ncbi:MAG: hypothetical protein IT381_02710 [Deltaproteobacteria bacterium]|nr:hypothetical protein [Deltaproteobacteria bacterium]
MYARFLAIAALFTGLSACGNRGGNTTGDAAITAELADAAPDVSALTLDEDNTQTAGPARDASGPAPSIAGHVKAAVKSVNDGVKAVLAEVDALIKTPPTTKGDGLRTWDITKNGLDYRLTVKKLQDGIFGWKMEAKKEADTAYTTVMGGKIKRKGAGLAPRRGAGFIGIDLTAYKAIADGTAAAITKSGRVFAAFAHRPAGAHLVFRLKDFKADTASSALPISAYFSGFRLFRHEAGDIVVPPMGFIRAGGRVNVSDFSDLAGVENETVTARLRRIVGVGGWGRAIIKDGNLPAGTRRIVRECWNSPATGTEALYLREVWDCTGVRDATTGSYPTCTQKSSFRYPQSITTDTGDPEAAPTKQRFLAQCFPDAAMRLRLRLQNLASNEPPLPEDPADAEAADETPVSADEQQDAVAPVENDDANTVDSADSLDDLAD